MPSTPVAASTPSTSNAPSPHTIPIYKPGHPTVFPALKESIFVDYLSLTSEWGFPIESLGLRNLAKSYLVSNGRMVPTFKNSTPGCD